MRGRVADRRAFTSLRRAASLSRPCAAAAWRAAPTNAHWEADAVQVRVRVGKAVQQVQAAVDYVEGVISAMGEEPSGGNVKLRQAQSPARCRRPGQEALRVHPRIKSTAGKQQPEVVAQTVAGDAGVHQDRSDEVERQLGEGRHSQMGNRPVECASPDSLILRRATVACSLPQLGPVDSAVIPRRCHPGHGSGQAGRPPEQERLPLDPRISQLPRRGDRGQLPPGQCGQDGDPLPRRVTHPSAPAPTTPRASGAVPAALTLRGGTASLARRLLRAVRRDALASDGGGSASRGGKNMLGSPVPET